MTAEEQVIEILQNVIEDFNSKWQSHSEQSQGIKSYAIDIENIYASQKFELPSDSDIELKIEQTVAKWKEVAKVTPELVPTNKEIIVELVKWMRDLKQTTSQKWVSVEERLPEIPFGKTASDFVLAVNEFGVIEKVFYSKVTGWQGEIGEFVNVTHWMPLPTKP